MSLDRQLAVLEDSQLIRRSPDVEGAFLFKHALTQDTAYRSLLVKTRREIHRRVAEAYERTLPTALDEYSPLLANHYAEAGDDPKTLEYAKRAGDLSARIYANDEAIAHYGLAITAAERLSQVGPNDLIELYTKRGRTLELAGRHEEALASYERLGDLSRQRGEQTLELASLMLRSTLYTVHTKMHDSARGDALAHQALALSRNLKDARAEARILWNLMLANQWGSGGARKAIEYGEQAVNVARSMGLKEQLAYGLSDLAYPYLFVGQTEKARKLREEADGIWRELDNRPMISDNLTGLAAMAEMAGDFEIGLAEANEANALSDAVGNVWGQAYSQAILGSIYASQGHVDESAAALEASLSHSQAVGAIGPLVAGSVALADLYSFVGALPRGLELAIVADSKAEAQLTEWRPWTSATIARLCVRMGDIKGAEEAIAVLPDSIEGIFERVWVRGAIVGVMAQLELALARGDLERASRRAEEFVTVLMDRGMREPIAEALCLQSQVLRGKGETERALSLLLQARESAIAINGRRPLFLVLSSLCALASEKSLAETSQFNDELLRLTKYILEHTTRPDLRGPFLNLTSSRAVLQAASRAE